MEYKHKSLFYNMLNKLVKYLNLKEYPQVTYIINNLRPFFNKIRIDDLSSLHIYIIRNVYSLVILKSKVTISLLILICFFKQHVRHWPSIN